MIEIFNKLKLKHSDPNVRIEAVKTLPGNAPELFETASQDDNEDVRAEAAAGIEDREQLEKLLENEKSERIIKYIHRKLDKIYLHELETCEDSVHAVALAAKLSCDQEHLASAACHTIDTAAAMSIAARVTNPKALLKIFRNSDNKQLCDELLTRIDDIELLKKIAHSAASVTIRHDAEARIAELAPPEEAAAEVETPQKLTSYQKEINKRHELVGEMEKLATEITLAKEEEYNKLVARWKELPIPADGMAEMLERQFKEHSSVCHDKLKRKHDNANRLKNCMEHLEKMCEEAEALVFSSDNWRYLQDKCGKLKNSWNKTTSGLTGIDKLNERFALKISSMESKLIEHEKEIQIARDAFKESCHRLEKALEEHTPEAVKDQVKEIRDKASETMDFLSGAKAMPRKLLERFHNAEKKFRGQLYQAYQARDLGRWEHYTLKLDICNEMESMLESDNFRKIGKRLAALRRKWFDLGSVPHEKSEEIQAKFDALYKTLRERCDKFFEEYKRLQVESIDLKKALCEKAESIQHSEDWHNIADVFKKLQGEWKQHIPAPKEVEQELYIRFRKACDTFFNRRKEHYGQLKKMRSNVIEEKTGLCEEAEKLAAEGSADDVRSAKILRRKWRESGHSGKAEHALSERFNKALDQFFTKLGETRADNINERKELCDKLDALIKSGLVVESAETFREINAKWRELPQVPGRDAIKVENQFADLTQQYLKLMEAIEFESYIAELGNLEKLEKLLSETETALPEDSYDLAVIPSSSLKQVEKFIEQFNEDPNSEKLHKKLKQHLVKRQNICTELEKIAGIAEPEESLSLAEELEAAILGNALTPVREQRDPAKELKKLRKSWDSQAPAFYGKDSAALYERYVAVCKAILQKKD